MAEATTPNSSQVTVSGSPVLMDTCSTRLVHPDRVADTLASMPPREDLDDLAGIFIHLGEPGRLRILAALAQTDELCVCDLAAVVNMSESSVSHALRLLRAARIVTVHRRGRMAYYQLDDAHVRMLLDLGLAHMQHTTSTTHVRSVADSLSVEHTG